MTSTSHAERRPVTLSIAGSDSGGGAGIQADLRVFSRLGAFGTTTLTAITAQNLQQVVDVHPVPITHVEAQLQTIADGFDVVAFKTGMLWSAECVRLVASFREHKASWASVIDPVMVATSGDRLLEEDAVAAYREVLLPGSTLITPNLDEAAVLLGVDRIDGKDQAQAAESLGKAFDTAVLLKGGHLEGDPVDILFDRNQIKRWSRERVVGVYAHGSGCMLSAAIAALLARGFSLFQACEYGLAFVHETLLKAWEISTPQTSSAAVAGIERAGGDFEQAVAGIERAGGDFEQRE
jgi:hydroxymethylpyrimidine/phosphomethylpyrimidine kinase